MGIIGLEGSLQCLEEMLKLGEHQPDTPFELNEVLVGSSIRRLGRKFKGKITPLENCCPTVTAHSDINTYFSNSLLCHLVSHLKKSASTIRIPAFLDIPAATFRPTSLEQSVLRSPQTTCPQTLQWCLLKV